MANVSAFIKQTKGKSIAKVRFYISRGRTEKRLFYTSDIKVNPDHFDIKKQIIKEHIVYDPITRANFNKSINDTKDLLLRA